MENAMLLTPDFTQEPPVQIKTFAASSTAKLDRKVNEFLARQDIVAP